MKESFEAFKAAADKEHAETVARFREKNATLVDALPPEGILFDYFEPADHLYATFGEPREAMAISTEHFVVLADPETLEMVAFEVPDFMKKVDDGSLSALADLARMLKRHPVVYMPTPKETKPVVRKIARELAAV